MVLVIIDEALLVVKTLAALLGFSCKMYTVLQFDDL